MKYLPLLWAGLRRNGARSFLIVAQVATAFALFGVLEGLNSGVRQAIATSHADRLYVVSRVGSEFETLPIGITTQLARVDGVVSVNHRSQLSATYQDSRRTVAIAATDPVTFAAVYPEIQTTQGSLQGLAKKRTAAIIGAAVALEYGWKVGDRIPLQLRTSPQDALHAWAFDVEGIFVDTEKPEQSNYIIVNYTYLNETRQYGRDTVDLFTLHVADPNRSADIGYAIDTSFANSSNETRTQSEGEYLESKMRRVADVDLVARIITLAAFAGLLVVAGALMILSVRDRAWDIAVLKTLGFTDGGVMALILTEVTLLCAAGAALGLSISLLLLPRAREFVGITRIPPEVFAAGAAYALLLALLTGAVPAWQALRLRIAVALSRR